MMRLSLTKQKEDPYEENLKDKNGEAVCAITIFRNSHARGVRSHT
jgi:hypothetical protein